MQSAATPQGQAFPARAYRYRVRLNALVTYDTGYGEAKVIGEGFQISGNGMAIVIPTHLDIGVPIKLELSMPPSRDLLDFKAVIRNRNEFIYGVALVNPAQAKRKKLTRYCAAMSLISAL